jgi:hypothetical protein
VSDDLGSLIEKWDRFAAQLEQGFSDGIDDYSFYLNARDVIEDILVDDSPEHLLDRLADIDRRVREATRPASPMRTLNARAGSIEFYSRAPRTVLPELRDDLLALGLVDWVTYKA